MNLLLQVLAILRALQWSHQTAHWKVRGEPFYGDHLLYQRLYEAVGEEIDTLAEKIVGMYGPAAITNLSVISDTHRFIADHARTGAGDSSYQCALQMEEHLQRALKIAYDELKESGELSLGMDDFLMATASAHETALYLLRQRLRSRMAGKSASLSYTKQKIELAVRGGTEEVLADVYGPWAIHKSLGESGWTITFVPLGLALARPKTQMDSRALLEAILEKVPSLADAATEADVRSHYNDIKDILRNPPKASGTAKRAPSMSLVQKREQVIQWLLEAGMRPKGGRSGKAGDFFYPPLPYGETPTLAISVGARDLLLNQYLMIGGDERWTMKDAELLSKVDEDLVKKWVAMSKSAPTRSEVRGGRMATASAHETALYLLRQRLRPKTAGRVGSALRPGTELLNNEQYDLLNPGDRILVNGRPKTVLNFIPETNRLVYVDEGKSTKRNLDVRRAVAWEPGEIPEIIIEWVGPGKPPAHPKSPRRRFTPPVYD